MIDAEVRLLADEALQRADAVLRSSREALDRMAAALLESETLTAAQIDCLLAAPAPAGP